VVILRRIITCNIVPTLPPVLLHCISCNTPAFASGRECCLYSLHRHVPSTPRWLTMPTRRFFDRCARVATGRPSTDTGDTPFFSTARRTRLVRSTRHNTALFALAFTHTAIVRHIVLSFIHRLILTTDRLV